MQLFIKIAVSHRLLYLCGLSGFDFDCVGRAADPDQHGIRSAGLCAERAAAVPKYRIFYVRVGCRPYAVGGAVAFAQVEKHLLALRLQLAAVSAPVAHAGVPVDI